MGLVHPLGRLLDVPCVLREEEEEEEEEGFNRANGGQVTKAKPAPGGGSTSSIRGFLLSPEGQFGLQTLNTLNIQ